MISFQLTSAQAVFTATALSQQIETYANFCRETDEKNAVLNDVCRTAMYTMLDVRNELVKQLRHAGYSMTTMRDYDTTAPEWQFRGSKP